VIQRCMFSDFLESRGMAAKADAFADEKRMKTERVPMPWREGENKIDCGVFAMRHMETYFGLGLNGWDSELVAGDARQAVNMRVKYCSSIIDCPSNEIKHVSELMSKKKQK